MAQEEIKQVLSDLIGHVKFVAQHFNVHSAHLSEAEELLKKMDSVEGIFNEEGFPPEKRIKCKFFQDGANFYVHKGDHMFILTYPGHVMDMDTRAANKARVWFYQICEQLNIEPYLEEDRQGVRLTEERFEEMMDEIRNIGFRLAPAAINREAIIRIHDQWKSESQNRAIPLKKILVNFLKEITLFIESGNWPETLGETSIIYHNKEVV